MKENKVDIFNVYELLMKKDRKKFEFLRDEEKTLFNKRSKRYDPRKNKNGEPVKKLYRKYNIEHEEKTKNSVLIHPGVSKLSVQKNMIKTITPEIWAGVIKLLLEKYFELSNSKKTFISKEILDLSIILWRIKILC